jgi:plasmid stabilization system protein ParE
VKLVEFAPAARAELDAAADRYELERPGRGVRFYAAVERCVRLIVRFPSAGPMYPGVTVDFGVRRAVVRGFPFVIAYRTIGDAIRIDAIAHSRRHPGYWHRRLK